jgi:Gpi18-like mannosyltransferase
MVTKVEEKVFKFVEKHILIFFLCIVTILSIALRVVLYENTYGDYELFLEPWFVALRDGGGLHALSENIGNYNAPYMTILALLTYLPIDAITSIKTVSVIFDYICGITVFLIAYSILKDHKNRKLISAFMYAVVILLPTVFINSACWAQCDSIYVAFALISILFLIKKKYLLSFIFLGISFSFKLQCIFLLPLYILIYIAERKYSVLYILVAVLSFIAMCVPSFFFGNTIQNVFEVYADQSDTYSDYLTMNLPNAYSIFWSRGDDHLILSPNGLIQKIGMGVTVSFFVLIAFLVLRNKVEFNSRAIIEFGLWSVMICTFLLPSMHERYMYLAEILAIVYLIFNKNKFLIPLGLQLITLYGYFYFLFGGGQLDIKLVSIAHLVLFVYYSYDMCKRYFSAKEDKENIQEAIS